MQAIRVEKFGGPEVLRLEDMPSLTPGPGEVVVAIKAAGVNPVDTYIRGGAYALKTSCPYTPGMDGAGVITAIGEGVLAFAPGDRVYFSGPAIGTYAQEAVCSVQEICLLPENITFAQGAAIGIPYPTACRALFTKARAVDKETVLIHGASGGVGIAAIHLARQAGLRVLATAGSARGLELVLAQGADLAFNHGQPDYLEEIRAAAAPSGIDIILETHAEINLARDLDLISERGRVVVIGCRGDIQISPRVMMAKEAAVFGVLILSVPAEERQKSFQSINQYLQEGKILPFVGQEFPLAQASQAHQALVGSPAYGKMVLTVE